jgi:mRNA interferase HigB
MIFWSLVIRTLLRLKWFESSVLRGFIYYLVGYLNLRYNVSMHIISRKALILFWEKHPDSQSPLSRWYKIVSNTEFGCFNELRVTFPSADKVDDLIVFNIAGGKYRLIASIHFNRGKVYVRHIFTHAEYDQGAWKR